MIAIHVKTGPFAPEWVAYCHENGIAFKEVDCFSSDIIEQLHGCTALLWHWPHHDFRAQLFARQLIASVERMGLLVFPSTATCWHYDDKVGQKYLLEVIDAPLIPTFVFYDLHSALEWIETTTFPKVWKLRGGAGSRNVRLVETKAAARKIIVKSFSSGWRESRFHELSERVRLFHQDNTFMSFLNITRGIFRVIRPHKNTLNVPLQKNYVYFQDFAPQNQFDIRVVIVGNRAFSFKRMVRQNDFRASGSGVLIFEPTQIPKECVSIAFDVTQALNAQCCAFDFVSIEGEWFIVEISYAFSHTVPKGCPGYWDSALNWHFAPIAPERFMLEDILHGLSSDLSNVDQVQYE